MGEELRQPQDETEESVVAFDAKWRTGHISAEARLTWKGWVLLGTGILSVLSGLWKLVVWVVEISQ